MEKTGRMGVYTRVSDKSNIVTFYITYRISNKSYKDRLGTNLEGWNVNRAFKERAKRIGEGKVPIPKIDQKQTLDDLAAKYFLSIKHKSDYKNTIGRYKNHIKPTLGYREFLSITVSDVQTLKLKLSKVISNKTGEHLSAKSINDMINLINTIYNYHNKINYHNTVVSPARNDLVERYVQDNSRLRFLSKDEYQMLLDYIANRNDFTKHKNTLQHRTDELLLYVKLLTTTGMRTYSALTLRAKDFNFDTNTITVKNHKSNRVYNSFIHNNIKDELQNICESINKEYYIFGKSDKPYHRSTINKRLLPILNVLFNEGVTDRRERVVVHSLRHTFGSWLAQQGISLYVICKLLDHKDISQTQVYSKLAPNCGRDVVGNILN